MAPNAFLRPKTVLDATVMRTLRLVRFSMRMRVHASCGCIRPRLRRLHLILRPHLPRPFVGGSLIFILLIPFFLARDSPAAPGDSVIRRISVAAGELFLRIFEFSKKLSQCGHDLVLEFMLGDSGKRRNVAFQYTSLKELADLLLYRR